jgi:DNA polymerase IIIc chi subunit
MNYQRKTIDEFEIQGLYSGQWESVTSEDSRKEARERLKEYRENERGTAFRLVKKRVKIAQAAN